MGIRFTCRHCGRRLNVKSSLAGKRGRCPHCQQAIEIPAVDEAAVAAATGGQTPATGRETPTPQREQAGTAPAPPEPAALDAISEAPHLHWYLMPAGAASQYGPASGAAFRGWLDEGRVAADSLVWREDWPDWRPAGSVFELPGHGDEHAGWQAAPRWPAARVAPLAMPAAPLAGFEAVAGIVRAAAAPGSEPAAVSAVAGPVAAAMAPVAAPVAVPVAGPIAAPAVAWPAVDPGSPSGAGSRRPIRYRRRSNTGPILAIVVLLAAMIPLSYMLWRVLNDQFDGAGASPASPAAADG